MFGVVCGVDKKKKKKVLWGLKCLPKIWCMGGCRMDGGKGRKKGGRVPLYRRILVRVGDSHQPEQAGGTKLKATEFYPPKKTAGKSNGKRVLQRPKICMGKIDQVAMQN